MNGKIDFAFLDSGTGGIPYMLALMKKEPCADCVYLGDTAHFPYGEKTPEQVADCASKAVQLIVQKWNPRALVIACNTISVTALDSLRERFPSLPIIGTVPAVKLASKISKKRKIGLLATSATVSNPYSDVLIKKFASDCEVFKKAAPDLVRFIEEDFFTADESEKEKICRKFLDYFAERDCDVIVLGCTHFTHIADVFSKIAGEKIKIIDSRDGVSNQALRICKINKTEESVSRGKNAFFVTKADEKSANEYKILCENCKIRWGGVIS